MAQCGPVQPLVTMNGPVGSHMVLCGPVWSHMALYGSSLVPYGHLCSHFVLYGPDIAPYCLAWSLIVSHDEFYGSVIYVPLQALVNKCYERNCHIKNIMDGVIDRDRPCQ